MHGGASPLPLEPGTRQRHHRHQRYHSSESTVPVSVPTHQALVWSRLHPSTARIKSGATAHHVDACSAPHDLMAATPKVHVPVVAASHSSVPKETKPSNSSGLAESHSSMTGDVDAPVSKKQPEEILPD
jgi:hypothetical protein